VVAEGVETAQQLSLLRTLGCDTSQGFFLHRPMPVAALEELLRAGQERTDSSRESPGTEAGDLVLDPHPA
jgi:sensor c-di-GMP phosphodiesterase-like protein